MTIVAVVVVVVGVCVTFVVSDVVTVAACVEDSVSGISLVAFTGPCCGE